MDKEINVRGAIAALERDRSIEFDRTRVKTSTVRNAAYALAADNGNKYQVNVVSPTAVRVTRTF